MKIKRILTDGIKFADPNNLDDGKLDILLVPFGGPFNGNDLYKEHFSKKTDLCLEWFPEGRPLLYHHGLDPDVKTVVVGRIKGGTKLTNEGHWVQAQLDAQNEYFKAIQKLIQSGKLYASSGAMAHLVEVDHRSGEILKWPLVEGSLTPTPANLLADVRGAVMPETRAAKYFAMAGLKFALPDLDELRKGKMEDLGEEDDKETKKAEEEGDGGAYKSYDKDSPLSSLPDDMFAHVDDDGNRYMPLHTDEHIQDAVDHIRHIDFKDHDDRIKAAKKITDAAKKKKVSNIPHYDQMFDDDDDDEGGEDDDDGMKGYNPPDIHSKEELQLFPNTNYAHSNSKGDRHLMLHDSTHVKKSMKQVKAIDFADPEDKDRAYSKIKDRASALGVSTKKLDGPKVKSALDSENHQDLEDSDFAYIDPSGKRHLPIRNKSHVKDATTGFPEIDFDSSESKRKAAKKIVAKARRLGIELSDDEAVVKATKAGVLKRPVRNASWEQVTKEVWAKGQIAIIKSVDPDAEDDPWDSSMNYCYPIATYNDRAILAYVDQDGDEDDGEYFYEIPFERDDEGHVVEVGKPVEVDPEWRTTKTSTSLGQDAKTTSTSARSLAQRTKGLVQRRLKEGRMLSEPNRRMLGAAVLSMREAIDSINSLLSTSPPDDDQGGDDQDQGDQSGAPPAPDAGGPTPPPPPPPPPGQGMAGGPPVPARAVDDVRKRAAAFLAKKS